MNFQAFQRQTIEALQAALPQDVSLQLQQVKKNNGTVLSGVIFRREDAVISPTIYLDDYYHKGYLKDVPFDTLIDDILRAYRSSVAEDAFVVPDFTDFDAIKDAVIFRLVHRSKNAALLSECPHIDYLDLAVTFHCDIPMPTEGTAQVMIRNEHMARWDVDAATLFALAKANTPRRFPLCCMDIAELLQCHGLDEPLVPTRDALSFPMYVLSNTAKSYGAAAVLYDGALYQLAEGLNDNLIILPSSVHEVIAIPRGFCHEPYAAIDEMVCSVNDTQLAPEEFLSDHCYFYDRTTNEMTF